MGGFGSVMLYTQACREVDIPTLCHALSKMEVAEPIHSLSWWRYPGNSLKRLRTLGMRANKDPSVWDAIVEIGNLTQFVIHKEVLLNLVPSLVLAEPCWHLSFNNYPLGDRLPGEWNLVPEAIRGSANDYGCGLTIGPHVQPIIRADQSDFAKVLVPEASFSMHFSGYPRNTAKAFDAMKSLPALQVVRQHLEPVLGPLEIDATWSF